MMDANQVWDVDEAIDWMARLAPFDPYWIEEPTSPDDILGHAAIARAVAPIRVATGEHVHNRVMFKQLLQADAIGVCQIDACRLGGVNEVAGRAAARRASSACRSARTPAASACASYVQHLALFDYIARRRRPGRPDDRVRRPSARAFRRPGRRARRTLPAARGPRLQRSDEGGLTGRVPFSRRLRVVGLPFGHRSAPQPPAIAGRSDSVSRSSTGVSSPCRWRMSVSLRNALTKELRSPSSPRSCAPRLG